MKVHVISEKLFKEAKNFIPGGVNSPVRAFQGVGGTPLFIQSAKGARFTDVDGKSYLDLVCSWGPLILGHAHPHVVKAIQETAKRGTSFGAPTAGEIQLARKICEHMPSIEQVRLVSSGTEATMSALRVARAFTQREKIVKFSGCYHGHVDSLLVAAGSGALTLGAPDSAGVTPSIAKDTLVLHYNDLEAVEGCFRKFSGEIAAIIVEPIAANMGLVLPKEGFLQGLREITRKHGALLIFDEVITGFRVALGGAQEVLHVTPDLTCLGKIIGGGLPVGAYGGRREIMAMVSPLGPVYQAGTLSGNPLAVAAGLATLEILAEKGTYEALNEKSHRFTELLAEYVANFPVTLHRFGSLFTLFFHRGPLASYEDVRHTDKEKYAKFFHGLLGRGVYLPPSAFEACFLSLAHSEDDLHEVATAMKAVLHEIFPG